MTPASSNLRNNLRASTWDGAAFGGMVGLGETYLAPFALAIGIGEVSAGLVASLPMIAGGFLQLVSLKAIRWVGSERRWILVCASLQGLTFLPLVYAALVGEFSLSALLLVVSLYWATGLATGPAWNNWIEDIVPRGIRANYFATRGRWSKLTTLTGFLIGGAILTVADWKGDQSHGYAMIFALACGLRLLSVFWLLQHRSMGRRSGNKLQPASNSGHLSARSATHGGRLLVFLVMLQGAVQLSGPFFTPFMLTELALSYVQFVVLVSVAFVAKVLSMSMWGRLSQRYSANALLWVGSIGIVPVSALWIVSQSYGWLLFVQTVSGVMWAAYELGFFLMFFQALPSATRVRMLTIYNFANTAAICVGALLGAWVLQIFDASRQGYLVLFGLSSCTRLLTLFILASANFRLVPVQKIRIRVLGLRPGSGSVDVPVIPSLSETRDDSSGRTEENADSRRPGKNLR